MVHHLVNQTSQEEYDLLGAASVIFFFMLSGFVMAITYGRKGEIAAAPLNFCWGTKKAEPDAEEGDVAASSDKHAGSDNVLAPRPFWRKRFARVAALYYLSNLLALPLFFCFPAYRDRVYGGEAGYTSYLMFPFVETLGQAGAYALSIGLTAINATAWVGISPPSGVTWCISTFGFFYLVTPQLLPRVQRLTSTWSWMIMMTLLQLVCFLGIVVVALFVQPELSAWIYSFARGFPPTRLPIFVMGMLAGFWALRTSEQETTATARKAWAFTADACTVAWAAILLTYTLATSELVLGSTGSFSVQDYVRPIVEGLIMPVLYVPWMISYTQASCTAPDHSGAQPGQLSLTGRFLSSAPLQWAGNTSFGLYMVHELLFDYTRQIAFGGAVIDTWWVIVLLVPAAYAAGWAATKLVEEPFSRLILTGSASCCGGRVAGPSKQPIPNAANCIVTQGGTAAVPCIVTDSRNAVLSSEKQRQDLGIPMPPAEQ